MELTLRHNPMLDDADCEAILAIHAAVGWDRRMPPAELCTLYQHSGYSLLDQYAAAMAVGLQAANLAGRTDVQDDLAARGSA